MRKTSSSVPYFCDVRVSLDCVLYFRFLNNYLISPAENEGNALNRSIDAISLGEIFLRRRFRLIFQSSQRSGVTVLQRERVHRILSCTHTHTQSAFFVLLVSILLFRKMILTTNEPEKSHSRRAPARLIPLRTSLHFTVAKRCV